jgi:methylated-DNA-protein-cysteine methyltransferase related protein
MSPAYRRIYAVIARVPRGRVATYGQIAALAGLPGRARQVGYALHALPDDAPLPWHRIVNARGTSSLPGVAGDEQRRRLARERIVIGANGCIDLARYGWTPKR